MFSDAAIGIAYYIISFALLYFMHKRRYTPFRWMFGMFAAFIFLSGTTHIASVWTFWHPDQMLVTVLNAAAALVAMAAAALLWPVIPKAVLLPANRQLQEVINQLEHEIDERKKAETAARESQATLRELAAYQERIREDERKRIAREIHDELGQNLLALRLDVASLHERASERHPVLQRRAATALEYIDTTMKSIRTIMNNLRPSVLDLGLPAAVEWQVRQFEARNAILCELFLTDHGQSVPDAHATAAFRILQESLNNIGRHARATYVRVEMRIDPRLLTLAIKDNGVGMYPGDRRKAHRYGLVGIEERITILGGELHIESTPGHGTVLQITIPLADDVSAERHTQTAAAPVGV
ncbi:sensor histidine kinase [Noviherbaspirillum saxi]|uniref:Sensor histidine kinase n=1 Tax=Noviherbaspirillum saxi TaxID=2320863 RepID=A0A3A3FUS2_9BURK|nr:sensor histidine kinase [Noviherbaspirillum saxi]RJF99816.1 sensor histidine kinase [Noviherbaspirillum saxi]